MFPCRPGIVSGQPAIDDARSADAQWSSWLTRGRQDYRPQPTPEPPEPTKRIATLMRKTCFCKHYLRGHCRFGDKCAYAHQAAELVQKPDLAKTRMCVHFTAGRCRNERCFFAHGNQELQPGALEEEQETFSGRSPPALGHPLVNQVWHLDREAEMELQLASLNIKRGPPGLARFDSVYQHNQLPQAPANYGFKVRDRLQSLGTTSRTESTQLSNGNMSQSESNASSEVFEDPLLSDVSGVGNSNGYNHELKETKLERAAVEPLEVAQLGCSEEMSSNSQDSLRAILKKYSF
jgi:hypothetical protein